MRAELMLRNELIEANERIPAELQGLAIDAEALIEEMTWKRLPHDPEIEEHASSHFVSVTACPICRDTNAELRYGIHDTPFHLAVCRTCGLGSLAPKPTPRQVARFYPPEYYGTPGAKFTPLIERLVRIAAGWSARKLMRDLPIGSRVLDVGCGRGVLLSNLIERGYEAHGFEISQTAADGADPRATITVADSLEAANYPTGFFDVIVLCHVLEHLPDPKATLNEIRRILKPGGRLVVSVPNFSSWQARSAGPDWFHLDLPRHLYHFPVDALKLLLQASGFDCRAEQHFSLRQDPFGWVQSVLNRLSLGPRNALYSLLKRNSTQASGWKTWGLKAAYWLGMPIGLMLSAISAAFRQGATVTIIAQSLTCPALLSEDDLAEERPTLWSI